MLAGDYVNAGWPVAAGAWWDGRRYRCDTAPCTVEGLHAARHADAGFSAAWSADEVEAWPRRPNTLLLPTGVVVDAVELPARATSAVAGATIARPGSVPVARMPTGRWLLLGRTGDGVSENTLHGLRVRHGVLHHGRGALVPLPPSRLQHGRVRWAIRPGSGDRSLTPVQDLLEQILPLLPAALSGLALSGGEPR